VSITPLRGRLELVAAQLHNPQEAERTGHGRLAGAAWCLSPPRAPRGARNPKKATFVTAIRAHQNFPRTPRVRQTFPTAIPHSPPTFGTFLTDSYICARFVVMDIVHLPAHSREARIQVLLKMPRSNADLPPPARAAGAGRGRLSQGPCYAARIGASRARLPRQAGQWQRPGPGGTASVSAAAAM
jgi:hypothetical protein